MTERRDPRWGSRIYSTDLLRYQEFFEEKKGEAVAQAEERIRRLRLEMDSMKERHKIESVVVHKVEQEKAEIQHELDEAEFWKKQYEQGHGLIEAVAYQKKLKADIKQRDRDLASVRMLLNDRIEAYEDLCV